MAVNHYLGIMTVLVFTAFNLHWIGMLFMDMDKEKTRADYVYYSLCCIASILFTCTGMLVVDKQHID